MLYTFLLFLIDKYRNLAENNLQNWEKWTYLRGKLQFWIESDVSRLLVKIGLRRIASSTRKKMLWCFVISSVSWTKNYWKLMFIKCILFSDSSSVIMSVQCVEWPARYSQLQRQSKILVSDTLDLDQFIKYQPIGTFVHFYHILVG